MTDLNNKGEDLRANGAFIQCKRESCAPATGDWVKSLQWNLGFLEFHPYAESITQVANLAPGLSMSSLRDEAHAYLADHPRYDVYGSNCQNYAEALVDVLTNAAGDDAEVPGKGAENTGKRQEAWRIGFLNFTGWIYLMTWVSAIFLLYVLKEMATSTYPFDELMPENKKMRRILFMVFLCFFAVDVYMAVSIGGWCESLSWGKVLTCFMISVCLGLCSVCLGLANACFENLCALFVGLALFALRSRPTIFASREAST